MQIDLNRLGSAGEYLDAVEQALDELAYSTARELLDRADLELEAARTQWREAEGPARALLGTLGKTVGERRTALAARIPKPATLTEGAPEPEDEPDEDVLAA